MALHGNQSVVRCCLVCSSATGVYVSTPDHTTLVYFRTLCDVVGLKDKERDRVLDKGKELEQDLSFCSYCRDNLRTWIDIQAQLEALTVQLFQITKTLTTDLTFTKNVDSSATALRECFSNITDIAALSPLDTNTETNSVTDLDVPVTLTDLQCQDDNNLLVSKLKPCCIRLIRVDATVDTTCPMFCNFERRKQRLETRPEPIEVESVSKPERKRRIHRKKVKPTTNHPVVTTSGLRTLEEENNPTFQLIGAVQTSSSRVESKRKQRLEVRQDHVEYDPVPLWLQEPPANCIRENLRSQHKTEQPPDHLYAFKQSRSDHPAVSKRRQTVADTQRKNIWKEIRRTGFKINFRFPCTNPNCSVGYPTEDQLRFHTRYRHEHKPKPYDCFGCGAEYRSLLKLQNHQKRKRHAHATLHSGVAKKNRQISIFTTTQFPFGCPKPHCLFRDRTSDSIRFHVRRLHEYNPRPYNCLKCCAEYRFLLQLRRHEQGRGHRVVPKSNKSGLSNRKGSMKKANKVKYQLPNVRPKPNCVVRCRTKKLIGLHTSHSCLKCSAKYSSMRELRVHRKETGHCSPSSNPKRVNIECEKCRYVFKYQSSFKGHLDRQGGECSGSRQQSLLEREPLPPNCSYDKNRPQDRRYRCDECGWHNQRCGRLRDHVKNKHGDGFLVMCEYCSKTFKRKELLQNHRVVSHFEQVLSAEGNSKEILDKLKSLSCDICDMKFAFVLTKQNHMVRVHSKAFQYICEICGIGKVSKSELRQHVDTVHFTVKRHKCTQCDDEFIHLNTFKRHLRLKHGLGNQPRFTCEECSKTFYEKYKLTRHVIQMHRKNDPTLPQFKCDLCNYSAVDKSYLHIHTKTRRHLDNLAKLGKT